MELHLGQGVNKRSFFFFGQSNLKESSFHNMANTQQEFLNSCTMGEVFKVESMLEKKQADVNKADSRGFTPLHLSLGAKQAYVGLSLAPLFLLYPLLPGYALRCAVTNYTRPQKRCLRSPPQIWSQCELCHAQVRLSPLTTPKLSFLKFSYKHPAPVGGR